MTDPAAAIDLLREMDTAPLRAPSIAFIGRAGSGKTTAAQFLVENQGYCKLSFADPLRAIACKIWGITATNNRNKLQRLGVAVREIDPDAWAELLFDELESGRHGPWVVDDCRFPNEFTGLRERGFVTVRVESDTRTRISRLTHIGKLQSEDQLGHVSETSLDGYPTDYDLENYGSTDIVVVYEQVMDILRRELRR